MDTPTPERSHRIEGVRHRLERWRRTRSHPRAPIPDAIWTAAVALVRKHGLYGTARSLRLDYGALKQHVEAADRTERAGPPAGFIELAARHPSAGDGCVIEIAGPRATVRLQLTPMTLADLAHLSRLLTGAV